jgi:hypothetical protein
MWSLDRQLCNNCRLMKQFACHMNLFFIQNIILTRWSKEHLFVLFILTVFGSNYWRNFKEKYKSQKSISSFFLPKKVQIKLFNSINRGPFLKRWIAKKSYSFRRVTPLVIPLLSIQTSRQFTFFWEGMIHSFRRNSFIPKNKKRGGFFSK